MEDQGGGCVPPSFIMNKQRLAITRDHIAHVVPNLELTGSLCLAIKVSHELKKQYQHTLVFETDPVKADPDLFYHIQAHGMEVIQSDRITPEQLSDGDFTGAILYNVTDHPDLGYAIPSVYYSYGIWDRAVGGTVISCSSYNCTARRDTPCVATPEDVIGTDMVIPPLVSTREWRRMKATRHPFTVGILTSGAYNKYPCRVVMELMSKIPKNVSILMTTLPRFKHMGVQLAIDTRKEEYRNTYTCSPVMGATLRYLMSVDALIYASDDEHYEPYGRLVVEAMALGKPVICENRGVFQNTLEHGVNAFLFNTTDEVIEYIDRIRKDTGMVELLGANAQMWASWQDTTVHIGKLKRVLREMGV